MSKIVVDVELLNLLQEACWGMKDSGGWEQCPACESPIDARGDKPFDWHAQDCKFRVGYERLKALLDTTKVEENPSFDPFDHLAGKVVKRAVHMPTDNHDTNGKHVASVDFEDGSFMSFLFTEQVLLNDKPTERMFAITPGKDKS